MSGRFYCGSTVVVVVVSSGECRDGTMVPEVGGRTATGHRSGRKHIPAVHNFQRVETTPGAVT